MDFLRRVNPKDINKLQLEGLVKSGAFDKIEKNRKGIFNSIPKIIQFNKLFYDEKISKQSNLFDIKDETKSEKFIFDNNSVWEHKRIIK